MGLASFRTAHDSRELLQGRIVEAVLFQEGVEAAQVAVVGQFDTRDVIGNRAGFGGDAQHRARRDVEQFRLVIDEPGDEPRAGYAVDLGAFRRDPPHDLPHRIKVFRIRPSTAHAAMT